MDARYGISRIVYIAEEQEFRLIELLAIVCVSCLAVSLAGCSLDRMQYYYIRLEGEGLRIEKQGRASPDALRAVYFSGHKDMPTVYSIARNPYTISIVFPENSYITRLNFSAKDSNGRPLFLGGRLSDRCTHFLSGDDDMYLPDEEPTMLLGLHWSRGFGRTCDIVGVHVDRAFPLELLIWDGNGKLLGTERLSYRILPNGVYWAPIGP